MRKLSQKFEKTDEKITILVADDLGTYKNDKNQETSLLNALKEKYGNNIEVIYPEEIIKETKGNKPERTKKIAELIKEHKPKIVLIRSDTRIEDTPMNEALTELDRQMIDTVFARVGVDTDNALLAKERGFKVANSPESNSDAVLELQLNIMIRTNPELVHKLNNLNSLGLSDNERKGYELLRDVLNNKRFQTNFSGNSVESFSASNPEHMQILRDANISEFAGKEFLLIGLGGIGKRAHELSKALNMVPAVVNNRLSVEKFCSENSYVKSYSTLEDALNGADYVGIAIPLKSNGKPEEITEGFFTQKHFDILAKRNKPVVVLGTARGKHFEAGATVPRNVTLAVDDQIETINSLDLKSALPEENPSNLIYFDKVGAKTEQASANAAKMILELVDEVVNKKKIKNLVNPETATRTDAQIIERMLVGAAPKKPIRASVSSGPTPPPKDLDWDKLQEDQANHKGMSHRGGKGEENIKLLGEEAKTLFEFPKTWGAGVIVGGGTAGIETNMRNFFGKNTEVVSMGAFSGDWEKGMNDLTNNANTQIQAYKNSKALYELATGNEAIKTSLANYGISFQDLDKYISENAHLDREPIKLNVRKAEKGSIPDLTNIPADSNIVLAWQETTAGTMIDLNELVAGLPENYSGTIIIDATSALGCVKADWAKFEEMGLKIAISSPGQKALGVEGGACLNFMSPAAMEELKKNKQQFFPLRKDEKFAGDKGTIEAVMFKGQPINTPSVDTILNLRHAISYFQKNGGLNNMVDSVSRANEIIETFLIEAANGFEHIATNPKGINASAVTLNYKTPEGAAPNFGTRVMQMAVERGYIKFGAGYKDPESVRIWAGPSMDTSPDGDLERICKGLEFCRQSVLEMDKAKSAVATQLVADSTKVGNTITIEAANQQIEDMLGKTDGSGAKKFKKLYEKSQQTALGQVNKRNIGSVGGIA
ncbi:MAG: NAD(P)-dependent oxidoreductase [Rickettsiales bacterium]|nr:NAD(P)-dependent oxidoreductase [Rickettsiales bacterium]